MATSTDAYPLPYRQIFQQLQHGRDNLRRYGITYDPPAIGFRQTPNPSAPDALCGIADRVRQCRNCDLRGHRDESRGYAVPGVGPAPAAVMIVGEAPGFFEERQRNAQYPGCGTPFVGKAGALLNKILASADIDRRDVFITNVVKCRPFDNRDPYPREVAACAGYLDEQIALVQPWVILAMGRIAAAACLGLPLGTKMGPLLGKPHDCPRHPPTQVWPLKHPAFLLRQPGSMIGYYEDMRVVAAALRKAKTLYQPLPPPRRL